VCDLRVERLAGRPCGRVVAPLDKHRAACRDHAQDFDAKVVEILGQSSEDAGQHGMRSDECDAAPGGYVLRLIPFDLIVHRGHHSRDIATKKRVPRSASETRALKTW
jgi:hypothetical protein